jgi:hypothetical protein
VTNPQGPPHQDPSIWARPGDHNPPTLPVPRADQSYQPPTPPVFPPPAPDYPATTPHTQPPSQDTAAPLKTTRRFRGDPVSIILVLVIVAALGIAGLVGGELYARNRADNVVATATECVIQDHVNKVSFGSTPFLWQHITGHYRDISIQTAGNNIREAKQMTADINIDDVDLHGNADSKGTIGALDATIGWKSDGIQETVQDAIPFIGGLVQSVSTDPGSGTIVLSGALGLGSVTVKPQTDDGKLLLQVVKVTALGAVVPHETAQAALDTFSSTLIKSYPLGIHADSVQVTTDGVVAHFSTRNAPIPVGETNPCFAHV